MCRSTHHYAVLLETEISTSRLWDEDNNEVEGRAREGLVTGSHSECSSRGENIGVLPHKSFPAATRTLAR